MDGLIDGWMMIDGWIGLDGLTWMDWHCFPPGKEFGAFRNSMGKHAKNWVPSLDFGEGILYLLSVVANRTKWGTILIGFGLRAEGVWWSL